MKNKELQVLERLPNVESMPNTATEILRDLIEKHNKLVEELEKLKASNKTK